MGLTKRRDRPPLQPETRHTTLRLLVTGSVLLAVGLTVTFWIHELAATEGRLYLVSEIPVLVSLAPAAVGLSLVVRGIIASARIVAARRRGNLFMPAVPLDATACEWTPPVTAEPYQITLPGGAGAARPPPRRPDRWDSLPWADIEC